MYKVFFGDTPVYLIGGDEARDEGVKFESRASLEKKIASFRSEPNKRPLTIHHHNLDELFKAFCSLFTVLEAAGGVVLNEKNELLAIKRLGVWDLPKGKMEQGEVPEECAVREVEEECGIEGLELKEKLTNSYHTYELKGEQILKKTHWYLMNSDYKGELKPQIEEDITEVLWMKKEQIKVLKENTYASILDVLAALEKKGG